MYCPHPLLATAGREVRYETFEAGESAGEYLRRLGYDLGDGQWFLSINGHLVHPDDWERVYPQAGDLIAVRARVTGSENGEKNPLATVLSLALIVVSYGASTALTAADGLLFGVVSQGTAQALIVAGGSLLINALLPPSKQNLSNALQASSDTAAATYSLNGGSNRARRYEPLTLTLGSQRVFPDLGTNPYTEFRGDDQYLIQVFHFGISDGMVLQQLNDFRIGDTSVLDYEGVSIEVSGIDGKLTLFPVNVDVVAGGTLTFASSWVTRTSSPDTTGLAIEVTALLFGINSAQNAKGFSWSDGETSLASVIIEGEYRPVGSDVWLPIFDGSNPFYATHYWSAGKGVPGAWTQYGYDTAFAYAHVEGDSEAVPVPGDADSLDFIFWRWRPYSEINGGVQGSVLSEPAPPELRTERTNRIEIASKSRVPVRFSTFLSVPSGQYQVRLRRLTPDVSSINLVAETQWAQLRSHQGDASGAVDPTDYHGQARVAVAIKATGQLNGTLDQFNARVDTWVPVWDGTTWVFRFSDNPAWQMLAVMRGGVTADGRRAWGCRLADSKIDFDALKAFAAWCDAKGLRFNASIDQRMNCLDLLNAIALAGRGSLSMANGKYGVVWDAPNQPVMQVFGLGNIKADTFAVRWVSEKLGDEIVLTYWNRDKDAQDVVRALVPGVITPANPVQVERFGVTYTDQAQREANLIAAAQKYRRRFVTFEADYEGQVIARGDVVALSHDLFASTQLNAWGYSGRLIAGTTTVLTLDRTVVMSATATNYCAVRFPDGQLYVRSVVYAAGTPSTLTLASALPTAPNADGLNPVVDYVWLFGLDAAGAAKKFKVQDVSPLDDKDVRITLVDENPLYYAAEFGAGSVPAPVVHPPRLPSITSISFHEELIRVGTGFAARLSVIWDVTGAYDHARVRVVVDGAAVEDRNVNGRRLDVTVPGTAVVDVVILPIHPLFGAGTPAPARHTVAALLEPPPNVPWLAVSGNVVSWGAVSFVAIAGYQLRFHYGVNTDWGQAALLQAGLATDSPIAMPLTLSGPVTLMIKAVSSAGVESAAAAYAVVVFDAPPASVAQEVRNWRFEDWVLTTPGQSELVNGALISNRPNADSAGLQMWNPNDTANMWGHDSELMWHAATYKEMQYWRTMSVTVAGQGSMLSMDAQIEGGAYRIDYRRSDTAQMWKLDSELMWGASPDARMWGQLAPEGLMPRRMWHSDSDLMWATLASTPMWHTRDGGWAPWPGQIAVENGDYEFRITTGFGPVRGRIVEVVTTVDSPTALEAFNNVAIAAGGTRLTMSNAYRQITSVSGAAFTDGGAAITFTVEDLDQRFGPLIKTRDQVGTPVAGTFTGFLQGVLS